MATGIIAEYNPFHMGHKYQLDCLKNSGRSDIVVCISGSITQRGELALLDKWQRAEAAVKNGASLVIELPAAFACRSAQDFAAGGVMLLHSLGIIDTLAFGTEYPNLGSLNLAADFQPEAYGEELQAKLKKGLSYGAAVSQLTAEKTGLPEAMLREPNTILAIEYLRAIHRTDGIIPLPIRRTGAGHRAVAPLDGFASGAAIRELVMKGDFRQLTGLVPAATFAQLQNTAMYPDIQKQLPLIIWQLLTMDVAEIASIYGVGEGLEYRLKEAAGQLPCTSSYKTLIRELVTRRYPASRLQRLFMHLLLKNTKTTMQEITAAGPLYIRILAFNHRGRQLLREIRKQSRLPLITRAAEYLNRRDMQHISKFSLRQKMLYLDIAAANLRQLCLAPLPCQPLNEQPPQLYTDFTASPVYV